MPDVTAERRGAARYPLALAADVVEISSGSRMIARTSDISATGCYLDTLSPVAKGSQVHLRLTYRDELLEVTGLVVYVSPGLGMGVAFDGVSPEQQERLNRWLEAKGRRP
jgi:hypothetical protein